MVMTSVELADAYRRYFPVVRAKCRRLLRDDVEAQDLAQEAFTKLWLHRDTLREPDAALSWLYRTVTRLAVDRLRRAPVVLDGEVDVRTADLADQMQAKELIARIAATLEPAELEALILHRVDRLTQPEIAEVLQVSERTVRRLLHRARVRLTRFEEKAS